MCLLSGRKCTHAAVGAPHARVALGIERREGGSQRLTDGRRTTKTEPARVIYRKNRSRKQNTSSMNPNTFARVHLLNLLTFFFSLLFPSRVSKGFIFGNFFYRFVTQHFCNIFLLFSFPASCVMTGVCVCLMVVSSVSLPRGYLCQPFLFPLKRESVHLQLIFLPFNLAWLVCSLTSSCVTAS